MKMEESEIVKFIEPIFCFCLKRVGNRADAEDLAGEIMLHILDGARRYEIQSFEAWVWRIAHNRYARFCKAEKNKGEVLVGEWVLHSENDGRFADEDMVADEYDRVFRYLHTLSSDYRNIMVDYYIYELPVKKLAEKYALPENTIKWRLHVSRQKIRDRIGENQMDKIYKRINWETSTCNGSMDSSRYLSNQVARAICESAYEKPLTVEEISLKTGLPSMYIEDALPKLIYGDAIEQVGNRYAANFIILRLKDREKLEKNIRPLVKDIADYFEKRFRDCAGAVGAMEFYGHDYGMERLGYIALPLSLRGKVRDIKNSRPDWKNGPYPPRKDGGYGWFIVEETNDENDQADEYSSGCNIADGAVGVIYYYHTRKYFDPNVYHNGGTRWLSQHKIPQQCRDGMIPAGLLPEEELARLLQNNLIVKFENGYMLNFACFTREQFDGFAKTFCMKDEALDQKTTDLILHIRESFIDFVPKRLDSQINQWVSCYVHAMTGYVTEELIARGVLEKPDGEKPLTNGVFYVEGRAVAV